MAAEQDVLIIELPVSQALVRDALNIEPVAAMASELAAATARKLIFQRRAEYAGKSPS